MADLQEIRARFVQITNRFDLINLPLATNTDNGANRFVNAGIRYLDQALGATLLRQTKTDAIVQGDVTAEFIANLSIERVTVIDSAGDRSDITGEWKTWEEFYFDHAAGDPTGDTQGKPAVWTVGALSDIDVTRRTELNFRPPADQSYTIELYGRFETDRLSANADVNYWSLNFPEALALAAAYELELTLGDTAAIRGRLEALASSISFIDNDGIDFDQWQFVRGLEE